MPGKTSLACEKVRRWTTNVFKCLKDLVEVQFSNLKDKVFFQLVRSFSGLETMLSNQQLHLSIHLQVVMFMSRRSYNDALQKVENTKTNTSTNESFYIKELLKLQHMMFL